MTGGITAQVPEHARAAQPWVHVRAPGHDMEVDMLKALCLGEEREIGFAAPQHWPHRCGQGAQQRAQISGFSGRQLAQRDHVSAAP